MNPNQIIDRADKFYRQNLSFKLVVAIFSSIID